MTLSPAKATLVLIALGLPLITARADITGFGGNGTGWTITSASGTPASIASNSLNIINGFFGANSAYFDTPQSISAFTATFDWQNTVPVAAGSLNPADGFAFTLQNSGLNAVGGSGGGLGYQGISPASGVAFNLFNGHTVGIGYAPNSTGNGSDNYSATGSVNLASTDLIAVALQYSGGVLDVNLQDLNTLAAFSTSFAVNLPGDAGGSTAFVGFTGGSGGGESNQTITNFAFVNQVPDASDTVGLLGFGLIGLAGLKRRFRK